ncbi:MAG: sulfatase-like hydrolase/transferase [Bryobacteraceae bacterium]
MNRRSFLGAVAAPGLSAAQPARRPNILFLMTDQQRYDTIGANGQRLVRTPNLDKLAAESANFSRCYVQSPVCVPSRVSWFTGRYPHSHRNRVNYTPLDAGEMLLQRYLKDAGYRTASVGKLHYWPPTAAHARSTGFDEVLLHDGVAKVDAESDYVKWRTASDPGRFPFRATVARPAAGSNPYRARIEDRFHETTWTGNETRRLVRELARGGQPFFLYSSFFQPHSPFYAVSPFDSMYDGVEFPLPRVTTRDDIERLPLPLRTLILRGNPQYGMDRARLQWALRTYHANIAHIDREVGGILEALAETGQAGNTIVVFSTDHGDQLLEHGLMGKNCFFEASVRLPFLMRMPGRIRPGRRDEFVETVDLVPTLFDLCGIAEPARVQGRSFAPLLRGEAYEARDAVFSENIIPEVITGGALDFRFAKGQGIKGVRHPDAKMVRTRRWKLVQYAGGEGELYDLDNDPDEWNNLFTSPGHRAVAAELKDRILRWLMTADEVDQIAPAWELQ